MNSKICFFENGCISPYLVFLSKMIQLIQMSQDQLSITMMMIMTRMMKKNIIFVNTFTPLINSIIFHYSHSDSTCI